MAKSKMKIEIYGLFAQRMKRSCFSVGIEVRRKPLGIGIGIGLWLIIIEIPADFRYQERL